jgi:hypothetical protein
VGGLDYLRVYEMCRPLIIGDLATTDENGIAKFADFTVTSGPEGRYTFIFEYKDPDSL